MINQENSHEAQSLEEQQRLAFALRRKARCQGMPCCPALESFSTSSIVLVPGRRRALIPGGPIPTGPREVWPLRLRTVRESSWSQVALFASISQSLADLSRDAHSVKPQRGTHFSRQLLVLRVNARLPLRACPVWSANPPQQEAENRLPEVL